MAQHVPIIAVGLCSSMKAPLTSFPPSISNSNKRFSSHPSYAAQNGQNYSHWLHYCSVPSTNQQRSPSAGSETSLMALGKRLNSLCEGSRESQSSALSARLFRELAADRAGVVWLICSERVVFQGGGEVFWMEHAGDSLTSKQCGVWAVVDDLKSHPDDPQRRESGHVRGHVDHT